MNDQQLLAAFVRDGSPEAFAEIVRAYGGMVFAAARRQVGDPHLAEDVAQAVFLLLAQKGASVKGSVAAWLLVTTRYACRDALKLARRRDFHERRAAEMKSGAVDSSKVEWESYADHLDAALASLNATDRDAIALRYLRGMKLQEIADAQGVNQRAAEKRVSRALDRLRKELTRKTATPAAAILAVQLTARGSEAAPASLAHLMPTGAVAGKGIMSGLIARKVTRTLLWEKVKIAAVLLLVIGAAGAGAALAAKNSQEKAPAAAIPLPPVVASTQVDVSPDTAKVPVTRVVEENSDALLKSLLDGLHSNQSKLQTLYVEGASRSLWHSATGEWIDWDLSQGRGWMESAAPRKERMEMQRFESRTIGPKDINPMAPKSFTLTWDGTASLIAYGAPLSAISGETYDTQQSQGEGIFMTDFSMQLPWDLETAANLSGTTKTIDRYPLDPAVLAQMKLSARHVILGANQDAMELTVNIPDPNVDRREIFWFDPARGYGLLARQDTLSQRGKVLRRMVRIIYGLTEAAPGVFYPSNGMLTMEDHGRPLIKEVVVATKVVANLPVTDEMFTQKFPKGMKVLDFKGAIGTKRVQN